MKPETNSLRAKLAALMGANYHPDDVFALADDLEQQGFKVLAADDETDLILQSDKGIAAIEAKNLNFRPLGFDSIAQARQTAERLGTTYRQNCLPIILGSFKVSDGVREVAAENKVKLMEINDRWSRQEWSAQLVATLNQLPWPTA